jgi:hypothetical protein
MANNNGVLRNKHILLIMDKLEIKYDEENLPGLFSTVYEDFLVPSFEAFVEIVNSLRISDKDADINNLGNSDDDYKLPPWLSQQYGPLELIMFEHYFSSYSDEFVENDCNNMEHGDDIRNDFNDDESHYSKFSGINSPREMCNTDEKEIFEFGNDNFIVRKLRGIMMNMNANVSELEVSLCRYIVAVACNNACIYLYNLFFYGFYDYFHVMLGLNFITIVNYVELYLNSYIYLHLYDV